MTYAGKGRFMDMRRENDRQTVKQKQGQRHRKWLCAALCMAVTSPLGVYAAELDYPSYNITGAQETYGIGNGSGYAQYMAAANPLGVQASGPDYIINGTEETTGDAVYTGTKHIDYGSIDIRDGGIWRPVDIINPTGSTYIVRTYVNNLTLHKGGMMDFGWLSGGYDPDKSGFNSQRNTRMVSINSATLYDGGAFRGNILKTRTSISVDTLTFNNIDDVTLIPGSDGTTTLHYQVGYVDKSLVDWSKNPADLTLSHLNAPVVSFTYNQSLVSKLDNFKVVGEGSYLDSPLTKYWAVPTVITSGGNYYWIVDSIQLTNSGLASESVMSAADNQRALMNMWRLNDSYVFSRGDALRRAHQQMPGTRWENSQPQVTEGVWANIYRGRYQYDSPYGRKVNQDYNSVFLGFDKENEGDFHNGTLYRGVFADIGNSDAYFSTGKGELTSRGAGVYASWLGNSGHFIDTALRFDKIQNQYRYTDSGGISEDNTYNTWAWGVSGQYGYTKYYGGGIYAEPVAGLSYGRMNATSYTLHNGLIFSQKGGDFLTGRAGIRFGKTFGDVFGGSQTNVYGRVMVNHEFMGTPEASTYFGNGMLKVNPIGNKDTWTDLTVGVQHAFRSRGSGWLELTKTAGGDVKSQWQVAGGLSWYWDPEPTYHGGARDDRDMHVFSQNNAAGDGTDTLTAKAEIKEDAGQQKKVNPSDTAAGSSAMANPYAYVNTAGTSKTSSLTAPSDTASSHTAHTGKIDKGTALTASAPVYTEPAETVSAHTEPASDTAPAVSQAGVYGSTAVTESAEDSYALKPVTVEADRPQWEKNLSPGTVSVVYPDRFKGEMKTLPELMQTVAGVFVQQVNGTGHYALARIRGSTGQQVNVYIDGVLYNSSGETGVDLSQIPVNNIERIEVYRGYVPARFAGAAVGGAINIVTKKPQGTTGSVGMGVRSYQGFTSNLEMNTPLAGGTLMFQMNRDQSRGDFPYNDQSYGKIYHLWRQYNWYRHTDGMVKWQDDHWIFKAQYSEKNEGVPGAAVQGYDGWNYDKYNGWWRGSGVSQTNKNTDILIGRRQQTGSLEWGAYLNYGDHKKRSIWHRYVSQWLPAGMNSYYNHKFWGARIDGNWKVNDSNMVEFLFNYSTETMRTDGNSYGTPEYTTALGYDRAFLPKYNIKHYYFQVQDSMALDRRKTLIFTPEWRAEKLNMTTFNKGNKNYNNAAPGQPNETDWKYSYGLALKKYISENWTVRGSYGTYYRAPNFYEMFGDGGVFVRPKPVTVGGDIVSWENGSQYDIGTDWKGRSFGANTNVSLSYFNRHVSNMSSPVTTADGSIYYVGLGRGKINGVELEANWQWKNWELAQTATWNNSHVTNYRQQNGTIINPNRKFPFIPQWETNSRLNYYFHDHKMAAFAEYHYISSLLYDIESRYEKQPTGVWNIGYKYNPGVWKFTVGINDIANRGPKIKYIYRLQGRTYYFTTQYSF